MLLVSALSRVSRRGWWEGVGPVLFVRNIWRPLSIKQSTFSLAHIILYKFHSDPTLHPLGKARPVSPPRLFLSNKLQWPHAPSRAVFRIRIRISICFWASSGSTPGFVISLFIRSGISDLETFVMSKKLYFIYESLPSNTYQGRITARHRHEVD